MHYFILLILVFMSPANSKPGIVKTASIQVDNMQMCEAVGNAESSKLSQDKNVSAVDYHCIEAVNPADHQT